MQSLDFVNIDFQFQLVLLKREVFVQNVALFAYYQKNSVFVIRLSINQQKVNSVY
ncbi:hypothetical protein PROPEN_04993 [Proteus penneri ATCC 35198]|nr:hypothetical protein PROPEN_04993 [Proteus penneri ATCC 35198]